MSHFFKHNYSYLLIFFFLFFPGAVLAEGGSPYSNLEETVAGLSFKIVLVGVVVLVVLTALSLYLPKPKELVKKVLFIFICLTTISTTTFLAASTVYLNVSASSQGPVHWHADIEIWRCNVELNLKDPQGLSNKIGTATLHEHSDKRIHLEGVVVKPHDASLGKFFKVIGGEITKDYLKVPTNEGLVTLDPNYTCPNQEQSVLQAFLFKVDGKNYTQEKLANPADYIISPQSQVPPGDCIIFELDQQKERTDRLCRSFKVAKEINKLGEEISKNGY